MRFLRAAFLLVCAGLLLQSGTSLRANGTNVSPLQLPTLDVALSQNFNALTNTPNGQESDVLPAGWGLDESGTSTTRNDGNYTVGTGSDNAGDSYAFGSAAGNSDRAFGGLQSGSLVPTIGAAFINNTGQPIRTLDISYTGEQWRLGTSGRSDPDRLDFQIGTSATSLSSGGYTDVDSLDFIAPITIATVGPLNGNLAANRATVSATVAGIDIPNGATFWIRWTDFNAAGADDGLAIDDFSITPHTGPLSTNPTATASADPTSNSAGATTLLTVNVTPGTNPPSSGVTVRANLSSIGGSATQSFFDDATHGDAVAGDNTFSFAATVGAVAAGAKTFAVTVRDGQGRAASASIAFVVELPTTTPIHDIQGTGTTSPFNGSTVMTRGVVTGVKFNGFFIQAPAAEADLDPNTSEGVFVFTSSTPPASAVVGHLIKVIATVSEFKNTASDPTGLSVTELVSPTVVVVSTGNPLPPAVTLSNADLFVAASPFQLEKYEAMRVHLDTVRTTTPAGGSVVEAQARSNSSGLFFGVLPADARPFREPGIQTPLPVPAEAAPGVHPPVFDGNYERIGVDTFSIFPDPAAAAVFPPPPGSTLEVTSEVIVNNITGPLDYAFRSYIVDTESWNPPTAATANRTLAPVAERADGEFTVASMNAERFFDTVDDAGVSDVALTPVAFAGRLQKMSRVIRDVLRMPDIIGVEEVENIAALQAIADQVNADAAAVGQHPDYHAFLEEGNDIGGIDSGFLVRGDRVDLAPGHFTVTQYGKTATYVEPSGAAALLNDRPALVLDAQILNPPYEPYPVTVIVNHLRSLSGVDGNDGLRIRTKRRLQAEYLAKLIRSFQDAGKHVISVGDYNAFDVNDGYVDSIGIIRGAPAPADEVTQNTTLTAADLPSPALIDLVSLVPASEKYSFLFDGNAQELDHILATTDLHANSLQYGRVNADFPESYRADFTRPERVSDHDPIVGYFNTPDIDTAPPSLDLPSDITQEGNTLGGALVSFSATAHDGIDGDLTPQCTPESGAFFPLGTTSVSCTAMDAHGNATSGAFAVTVVDTTPPALTLPLDITLEATSPAGAEYSFAASALDIVSGSLVVHCSSPSGSLFSLGPTVNACDATDGSGNTATGSFTVIVEDTTAPTVNTITATPNQIWPTNKKMIPVVVSVNAADAVSATTSRIISITGDDGATAADWVITGPLTATLRADRTGAGNGRTYTMTVETTDAAGNTATSTVAVLIPHDQGK